MYYIFFPLTFTLLRGGLRAQLGVSLGDGPYRVWRMDLIDARMDICRVMRALTWRRDLQMTKMTTITAKIRKTPNKAPAITKARRLGVSNMMKGQGDCSYR